MTKHIQIPMTNEEARTLKAGERVLLTGTMYTARDAAHKRIVEEVKQGKEIPISLKDVAIYLSLIHI